MRDLGSTRVFGHGSRGVIAIGLKRQPMRDLYHWLVTGRWSRLLAVYALVYFATEALFGAARLLIAATIPPEAEVLPSLLYALDGPAEDAGPLLSTRAIASSVLSGLEGFVHWLELVLGAGLVLAKFSLVRARVLFSDVAVVAPHAGGSALMFRMANERTSHLVDAKVSAMLVRNETSDGEVVRRAHDLELSRGGSALFSHAWTAIHPITRESPFAGASGASLQEAEAEVIVTLSGYDEALTKVMHARHVYPADRIRWNARFKDIVRTLSTGLRAVDYRKFHDVVSVDDAPERTPTRKAR